MATKKSTLPEAPDLVAPSSTAYNAPTLDQSQFSASTADSGSTISDNALVQNRFNGLIAENSPLIQMARTKALQDMNARGTQNSSMAQGAADAAAYAAALPIAQQDAATYAEADLDSHATQNKAGLVSQAANYDTQSLANQGLVSGALADQTFDNNVSTMMLENDIAKDQTAFTHPYTKELAKMGYDAAIKQTNISSSASIASSVASSMASILNNSTITNKISARDSLISAVQSALSW